ncbi:MAG: DUF2784 domain-containing protein [bacterium]|nr:DUF2784 domain-containing protein [bacterium]
MLWFADILFDVLHIGVILFNLFGWIPRRMRFAHRILLAATAFFWLVVGPAIGALGYCPLTDWHWRIKEMRGARNLPGSYIDYLLDLAGITADPQMVQIGTGVVFALTVIATLWMWRRDRMAAAR